MQPHDTVTISFRDHTRLTEFYEGVVSYFADYSGFLTISTTETEIGISVDLIERYTASGGDYS